MNTNYDQSQGDGAVSGFHIVLLWKLFGQTVSLFRPLLDHCSPDRSAGQPPELTVANIPTKALRDTLELVNPSAG